MTYCWWKKSCTSWYGSLSHYLQGFIHPRLFGISSIKRMTHTKESGISESQTLWNLKVKRKKQISTIKIRCEIILQWTKTTDINQKKGGSDCDGSLLCVFVFPLLEDFFSVHFFRDFLELKKPYLLRTGKLGPYLPRFPIENPRIFANAAFPSCVMTAAISNPERTPSPGEFMRIFPTEIQSFSLYQPSQFPHHHHRTVQRVLANVACPTSRSGVARDA